METESHTQTLNEWLNQGRAKLQAETAEFDVAVETEVESCIQKWILEHPNAFISSDLEFQLREAVRKVEAFKRGKLTLIHPTSPQGPASLLNSFANCDVKGFQDALKASSHRPADIVESLVLEQSPTIVSALPHGMKSFSWLQACIEAPARKTVWHQFAAPNVRNTLFIETEDPQWLVEARVRWIATGLELRGTDSVPGFHYFCPGAFDLVNQLTEVGQLLNKYKPDFVVLSTLQNILGGRDWKEPSQMFDVNAAVVQLSRRHCPVVLITHSPWDKRQRRAAGSVTLAANFPTALHYEKKSSGKGNETTVNVLLDSKVGHERNFHLRAMTVQGDADLHSLHLEYGGDGRPKGSAKAEVEATLEDEPDATSKDIAARHGVSERYVNKLKKARRAGEGGG